MGKYRLNRFYVWLCHAVARRWFNRVIRKVGNSMPAYYNERKTIWSTHRHILKVEYECHFNCITTVASIHQRVKKSDNPRVYQWYYEKQECDTIGTLPWRLIRKGCYPYGW